MSIDIHSDKYLSLRICCTHARTQTYTRVGSLVQVAAHYVQDSFVYMINYGDRTYDLHQLIPTQVK